MTEARPSQPVGMFAKMLARLRKCGLGKSRTRRGVVYADPLRAGRHPFQTYLLALCVASSFPLVFGPTTPNTIHQALPGWLVTTWGLFLLIGSVVALAGSYWTGDYANGLTLERTGLALTGVAGLIYGFVIVAVLGWSGLLSGAITIGFGAACVARALDIGYVIRTALAMMQKDVDQ